ncbi:MAG: HAD family hydrolase [Oscillospiraceae bacterium]|nr:HAD family hydrolase [Oscillospiraceae bacterium]
MKYPCLVLDHDDTVVQTEATINYPYFCYILDVFRPGATITLEEYIDGCFHFGFADMCRQKYHFTEQELKDEYAGWKAYIREHIPATYSGIGRIIRRQKAAGGLVCVVSHSSEEIIRRDYQSHFGLQPDEIFGWDYPEHQRKPSSYPLQQIMAKYHLAPEQLLVVDDLKPAVEMAGKVGVSVGFAQWSKTGHNDICQEMSRLCQYTFETVEDLEHFLFDEKSG